MILRQPIASYGAPGDEWRKGQPAQMQVKREKLVEAVKGILGGMSE